MGLIVFVYRNNLGDSTRGGISSDNCELTLMNVDGPFEPTPYRPAALLVPGNLKGTVKIVPENLNGRRSMFGGNYAATSDIRFTEAIRRISGVDTYPYGAVPIHDRFE